MTIYDKTTDGNSDSIVLSRKGVHQTCEYRPDVIADHDVGRDIYEVVGSETVNEAVVDILQFLSTPGRCKLRIFCRSSSKRRKIEDTARVILYNLGTKRDQEFIERVIIYSLEGVDGRGSLRRRLRRIIFSTMTRQ
jgi:hypothetical protein